MFCHFSLIQDKQIVPWVSVQVYQSVNQVKTEIFQQLLNGFPLSLYSHTSSIQKKFTDVGD